MIQPIQKSMVPTKQAFRYGFHIELARIRQVVQKYLRIARRSNATRKNVVGLGKKVRVECDVESLNVAFDMREVKTSKSGIRRSKTLESTCRIRVYAEKFH